MQRSKTLAVATGFSRFTVQDLASASGTPENTVRDMVAELCSGGMIKEIGKRVSKRLGRPSKEYSWTDEGRHSSRERSREMWPLGLIDGGEGMSLQTLSSELPDDLEIDPFAASLSMATQFIEALEGGLHGEEASRLWKRAEAELQVLQRRVLSRSDDDVSALAALSLRLEGAREEPRIEDIRTGMVTWQAELLKQVAGIQEATTANGADPDQLEQGYGIVLDVSRPANPTAGQISMTLAEMSRHCFVLNFHDHANENAMTEVLKDLSVFLSTPLSVAARIFIVVDRFRASWRKAEKIVDWFDQVPNLRISLEIARRRGREAAGGIAGRDAAMLFNSRAAMRSHDWLGQGLNKQTAMRLMATKHSGHFDGDGSAARIALNNPLVIHTDPSPPHIYGDKLHFLMQRATKDKAVIRGLVIGSFATSAKILPIVPSTDSIYDQWMTKIPYFEEGLDAPSSGQSVIAGLLPAPSYRDR